MPRFHHSTTKLITQANKYRVYYTHCFCLKPEIAKEKNDNKLQRGEIICKSLDKEAEVPVNR